MLRTRGHRNSILLGFLCLGLCLLLSSCRRKNLEARIASNLKQCSYEKPCRLKLSDLTPFDWDRGYSFYNGSKSDREKVLGVEDIGYQQDERQLVFLKDGRVIFQEGDENGVEAPTENELIFGPDTPRSGLLYSTFHHDDAFLVREMRSQNGIYYEWDPTP